MSAKPFRRIMTRAASRAGSVEPAPSEAGSTHSDRSTRSGSRIPEGVSGPRGKSTRLYGTGGPGSAKRDSGEAEKTVGRIEDNAVEPAQAGGTGTVLATIEEEAQGGGREGLAGGNVSGISRSPKVSQLTTKTYEQEIVISTNSKEFRRSIERWNSESVSAIARANENSLDDSERTPSVRNVFKTLFYILLWSASVVMPFWGWWRSSSFTQLSTISDQLDKMDYTLTTNTLDISNIHLKVDKHMETNRDQFSAHTKLISQHTRLISDLGQRIHRLQGRIPRVNYFSYDLGARVNYLLTSPRMQVEKPVTAKFGWLSPSYWFGKHTQSVYTSRDSSQALKGWSEPLDRWCAPSQRGKLQLAIKMPRAIAPETLVVEHYPMGELIVFGAAPREIELWLRIMDDAVRIKVLEIVLRTYPHILTQVMSQKGKKLDEKQALDGTWVPVGQWVYSMQLDADNIQHFQIPVDLSWYGVAVDEAAVRVNSNWGSLNATCLYRVVLHGKYNQGPDEVLGED